ncbi:hypothetical protein FHS16_004152 [Paenibacillus endophyticus]|uniref:Acetyltransferase n=1 Tax=Paenibacillus endophyticus TaxID=1294268 RepID=A0A7W5GBR4_9BACL|nr:DapH/DapD/GlmU-related protein [Paenibacillus endophyticus]MBB3154076.1 hypothetical protein [Paenibacillus endophyticus]
MFGPNVTVATAGHPIVPHLRENVTQFNLPVHIGRNVWIGAGAIIVPGVKIGDNTVIGAGSVVTKDIPSNVVAVGNPCRVLREINDHDKEYYYKDKKLSLSKDDGRVPYLPSFGFRCDCEGLLVGIFNGIMKPNDPIALYMLRASELKQFQNITENWRD